MKTLVDTFGTSSESVALYGTGDSTAFVQAVFQNVLGRAPAASGLAFWSGAIDNGTLSRGDAALSIMAGALSNTSTQGLLDAQLVHNHIVTASYYTAQVVSQNATSYYKGAAAAASARATLAGDTAQTDSTGYQPV
ncbi:MAG TPA: DUF4214 domain-containing protein, partial [Burkholderiaceae bacterium]